jgi:hypothetical protein
MSAHLEGQVRALINGNRRLKAASSKWDTQHAGYEARSHRPSLFQPRPSCGPNCGSVTIPVCPVHFPVETVAMACLMCGRVWRYIDNLLLFTPKEALQEFQARPWAVRGGIAFEPSLPEVSRVLILDALAAGMTEVEIATEYDCELDYVRTIKRAQENLRTA